MDTTEMDIGQNSAADKPAQAVRNSQPRARPFPAFAAPLVRILATPIKYGFRYSVRPQDHGRVTAYCLKSARETARLYSRRIIEVGQARAFHRRRVAR
jgi:hypothetical protein